jgi:hypothetical protein
VHVSFLHVSTVEHNTPSIAVFAAKAPALADLFVYARSMRWGIAGMDEARGVMLIGNTREGMQFLRQSLDELMELTSAHVMSPDDTFRCIWHAAHTVRAMRDTAEALGEAFGTAMGADEFRNRFDAIHLPTGADETATRIVSDTISALCKYDQLLSDLQDAALRQAQQRLDGTLTDEDLATQLAAWSRP